MSCAVSGRTGWPRSHLSWQSPGGQSWFTILEKAQFCRNRNLYGYVDYGRKFVICTRNVRLGSTDSRQAINTTLQHEAVHVSHMCNGYRPFGIAMADMPLPPHKLADVRASARLSHASAGMEHEAHWLEDKPQKIRYVIKRYCFSVHHLQTGPYIGWIQERCYE